MRFALMRLIDGKVVLKAVRLTWCHGRISSPRGAPPLVSGGGCGDCVLISALGIIITSVGDFSRGFVLIRDESAFISIMPLLGCGHQRSDTCADPSFP